MITLRGCRYVLLLLVFVVFVPLSPVQKGLNRCLADAAAMLLAG